MTPRAKEILRDGIHIYNAIPDKQASINTVKENLAKHYKAIESIGMGLDEDKVRAGEIFLRIYNKQLC